LNDENTKISNAAKNLGVMIDEKLSFKPHILIDEQLSFKPHIGVARRSLGS